MKFTAAARRLGILSAAATVVLVVAYAVTLVVGLASLGSPQEPIGDPMFTILEVLIIAMMPAMVAVHAWAPEGAKAISLTSVVFIGLLAGLTCVVHFSILTLSRQPEFAGRPWMPLVFSFEWPSVAYALDILAWDVFFALSKLFAAPAFSGGRLAAWIRALTVASGVFLVVAALLAVLFYRATPREG